MHRSILQFFTKPTRNLLTSLLFSNSFCPFSTLAAIDHPGVPLNTAVSVILSRLINVNFRDKKGFAKRIGRDPEFKTLISGLCSEEIDGIIDKLRIQFLETALDFFYLLKNEYGVKHSRDSYFFVAHVLASKQRFRALRCHLLQMVQQEGSRSAPSLCELLSSRFREWDSNHLVWDTLAFSYSRGKMVQDALFVLYKMKDLNMQASMMTFNGLLYSSKLIDSVWDVDGELKASGISPGDYVNSIVIDGLSRQSLLQEAIAYMLEAEDQESGPCKVWFNNLITGFCKLGFVNVAKSFFCMMYKYGFLPDTYSYNILIHGMCIAGSMEEALDLTSDMEKHGLKPDIVTYNTLAKGFTLLGSITGAGKIVELMLRNGVNPDLITYTILICGHCQTGNIKECFKLREEVLSQGMQMTIISYGVMISSLCKRGSLDEALFLFHEMKSIGLEPDVVIYSVLIHGLCRRGQVLRAVHFYKEMCLNQIMPNIFTHRSILLALSEKGSIVEARKYFDCLIEDHGLMKDIGLCNIMIYGYAKHGYIDEAVQLYQLILEKGILPTVVTFNSLLYGFCKARRLTEARRWLNTIDSHNLVPNAITYTTLMNALCEEENVGAMLKLLGEMEARDIKPTHVTYTVVIKGLCRLGKLKEAVRILQDMFANGLSPDETSYNIIIQGLCRSQDIKRAFQLHDEMVLRNLQPNHVTYNILMEGLCVYGNLKDADKLFILLHDKNSVTKVIYTTLIKAHCAKGDVRKALVLFHQMVSMGYEISIRDCSAVVNRLCKRLLIKESKAFLRMVLRFGIHPDQQFCAVILEGFFRIHDQDSMFQLFALMVKCGFDPG